MPKVGKRFIWSDGEVLQLREIYSDNSSKEIAEILGTTVPSVHKKASLLGLFKSEDFLKSPKSGRLGHGKGIEHRFQKGCESHNKGKKVEHVHPNSKATQFKKGNGPKNWVPVGSEKVNEDGYWMRKVTDTGHQRTDWQPIHRLNWAEQVGPIPDGMTLCFLDSDRNNTKISNLELVSRQELMARNTIRRFPQELVQTIFLLSKAKRKIKNEQQINQ